MIRHVRFVGGPMDGEVEAVRDPGEVLQVALPQRVRYSFGDLDPTGPAYQEGLYRQLRRRWNGFLVYEYDGPNAWAVFDGDDELSDPFPTKREAHEWLRAYLKDPVSWARAVYRWPEVRWAAPA